VVVSVNPNIPHNCVSDPQTAAVTVLSQFGYQHHNVVIGGYSLEKSFGGDDLRADVYDPRTAYVADAACENVQGASFALPSPYRRWRLLTTTGTRRSAPHSLSQSPSEHPTANEASA
jgi:hypothetical protein